MPGWEKHRETVAMETPARAATSTMPGAPLRDFLRLMGRIWHKMKTFA
jgi:hypothetical protein